MKRSLHAIINILIFLAILAGFFFLFGYNYIKAAGGFLVISENKISHRFVKKIKIDGNFIYVGTADKFNIYNIKDDKNIKVEGLRDNYITAIAYDNDSIWVGTPNGLAQISKKDYKVKNFDLQDGSKKLPDNYITEILVDGSQIWIASKRWGVLLFDPSTGRWKGYSILNGLAGNNVNALALDGQSIWAGTDDGLSVYDKTIDFWKSYTPQDGLAFNKVSSIAVDGEFIWAGTLGGGLSRLNKLDDSFLNYTTSAGLVDDNIQCLTLDGKLLWIGTFAGVNKFDKDAIKWEIISSATGLPEDSVGDIAINGNFAWFATDGGGIARMDKVIPEAYISPLTHYIKSGTMQIIGTSYSFQDISSFVIEYKSEILNQYSVVGIAPEPTMKILNSKMATFDVSRLINGTYYLKLTVKDKANNVNISTLPVVVDTVPPSLTLDSLPESVKDPELVISGKYNEMNLIRISIKNNGETLLGGEIDRIKRTFSASINLHGGVNKIEITAEDIAGQKSTATRSIIYDTDKPEFLTVTKDAPSSAKVKISGEVKDFSLSRVVFNPGNLETTFTPVPDKNYVFNFEKQLPLVQGENKFTIDAYDMVGNKTTYPVPTILYMGGGPVVTLTKTNTKVYEPNYVVIGTYAENNLREILMSNNRSSGYVKANVDTVKKTFSANMALQEGENILTAYIINKNTPSQKSFDFYSLYYSSEMSKFTVNAYDRYTSFRKVLITGRFKEENLKEIVLNPGEIRASVDFNSNTFQVFAPVLKDQNNFKLVMVDKLGGTTQKDISISFDDQPPKVKLDEIPPVINASPLIIKGTIDEQNFNKLVVNPGNIIGQFNPKDKTFKVSVPLNAGENALTLSCFDLANSETPVKINVKYIPQLTAGNSVPVNMNTQQTGDSNLLMQIAQLRQEVQRLQSSGARVYIPVQTGPKRVPLPKEKAVFFAPFDQKDGDTLLDISKYYLGSASYISLISAFNDVLDASIIQKRKMLLLPSKSMIQFLNQYSIFDTQVQVVNSIAMAYNSLGASASLNDYYSKFIQYISMSRQVQPVANGSSVIVNDVMVVLMKGRTGDFDGLLRLKSAKGYKNIVVGQIGAASIVYSIL